MSSLRNFFRSKKEHENKSKLQNMSPEQIVRLDPKTVSSKIVNDNKTQLSHFQNEALKKLLFIKEKMKEDPTYNRERAITNFLNKNKFVDMANIDKYVKNTEERLKRAQNESASLRNQFNSLYNSPFTQDEEEELQRELDALGKGGSKKRKTKKRNTKKRNNKKQKTYRRR